MNRDDCKELNDYDGIHTWDNSKVVGHDTAREQPARRLETPSGDIADPDVTIAIRVPGGTAIVQFRRLCFQGRPVPSGWSGGRGCVCEVNPAGSPGAKADTTTRGPLNW